MFHQSVANLMPGNEIRVRLRTVEVLEYTKGDYRFTFPLVVGPRYVPGAGLATGDGSDADGEPIVSPPTLARGERSGHDVRIRVSLDAGVPIASLTSPTHRVRTDWSDPKRVVVELEHDAVIPNKDFVLRWNVSSDRPAVGLLAHRAELDGYFALLVQPRGEIEAHEAAPKEIVLVLDDSGSMSGLPLRMSRWFASRVLGSLGDRDTFNLIRFAGDASVLAERSLDSSAESTAKGRAWLNSLEGAGGTEMLTGLREAAGQPADPDRTRLIVFVTDGYIGNENGGHHRRLADRGARAGLQRRHRQRGQSLPAGPDRQGGQRVLHLHPRRP